MEHVRTLIESLVPHLEQMVKTQTVVGEPIRIEGKTLIPLLRASFGVFGGGLMGQGEGTGKSKEGLAGEGKGEAKGGGTGGGLKLSPAAVICIDETGVRVFPIEEKKGLAGLVAEVAPQIIARHTAAKSGGATADASSGPGQAQT